MSNHVYRPRRWPLVIVILLSVASLIGLEFGFSLLNKPNSSPELKVKASESSPLNTLQVPHLRKVAGKKLPLIKQSPVTNIFLPAENGVGMLEYPVWPLENCRDVIIPPTSGPRFMDVFACMDYDHPGTNSPGFTVLAGHSSLRFATVMNSIVRQKGSLRGRHIWLKTRSSGRHLLDYRIEKDPYTIDREDLPKSTKVWGTPSAPTPNRLVLVTCLWNEDGTVTDNLVVVAELAGVR